MLSLPAAMMCRVNGIGALGPGEDRAGVQAKRCTSLAFQKHIGYHALKSIRQKMLGSITMYTLS